MKIGRMLLEWDEYKIAQEVIRCEVEERQDEIIAGVITEEMIVNGVYSDADLFDIHYDSLLDCLTECMRKKNFHGYWRATVKNFGWRNQDGYKYFVAEEGRYLLSEILPKCDCTFRIFNYGKGIAIQNFHHDSPMGNEWYYITPVTENTYYRKVA